MGVTEPGYRHRGYRTWDRNLSSCQSRGPQNQGGSPERDQEIKIVISSCRESDHGVEKASAEGQVPEAYFGAGRTVQSSLLEPCLAALIDLLPGNSPGFTDGPWWPCLYKAGGRVLQSWVSPGGTAAWPWWS